MAKQVSDFETVEAYARRYGEMCAMIESINKFIATMPAPDEDGIVRGVDYGYIGDVGRVHELLRQASDLTYEMSE